MGRRRDSHRRPQRELTAPEWMELLTNSEWDSDVFASEEEHHETWLAHRDELMEQHRRPGVRPGAWWRFEAPEGAPDREDYRGRYCGRTNGIVPDDDGALTAEEFELAQLRFLASHGLLSGDEIAALLAAAKDDGLTPYAREMAERGADAVLDGLAKRDKETRGVAGGR